MTDESTDQTASTTGTDVPAAEKSTRRSSSAAKTPTNKTRAKVAATSVTAPAKPEAKTTTAKATPKKAAPKKSPAKPVATTTAADQAPAKPAAKKAAPKKAPAKPAAKKAAPKKTPVTKIPARAMSSASLAAHFAGVDAGAYGHILDSINNHDWDAVIEQVRDAYRTDPVSALASEVIQVWLGIRFRNIFMAECERDEAALRNARVPLPMKLLDRRSSRELIAVRYFKRLPKEEIKLELPAPQHPETLEHMTLVFAPGLLTGLLPVLAFQSVWPQIEDRFKIRILAADSHPVRPCIENVADLHGAMEHGLGIDSSAELVDEASAVPPGDVIMMGYSKGGPDILTYLTEHPEVAPRVKAVVGWAAAMGGSYMANDIYDKIKDLPLPQMPLAGQIGQLLRRMVPVLQVDRVSRRLEEYDVKGALGDLTTHSRERFLAENSEHLASLNIPVFTFSGATSVLEVPYYQALGTLQLNAWDKDNDMQLTQSQTRVPVPHSAHLATFRGHHWDLSYDPFPWFTRMGSMNVDHKFARIPAVASILLLLNELSVFG